MMSNHLFLVLYLWQLIISAECGACHLSYWSALLLSKLFLQLAVIVLDSMLASVMLVNTLSLLSIVNFMPSLHFLSKLQKNKNKKLNWNKYKTALKQIFILQGKIITVNNNFWKSRTFSRCCVSLAPEKMLEV